VRKLIVLGASGIHWGFAIALLAGGLIAAPLAALLVRIAHAHLLGVAVGGLIVLTNARTLLGSFEVPNSARIPVYVAILLVAATAIYLAALRAKRRPAAGPAKVALEAANA
jgi:uncharacterized protein